MTEPEWTPETAEEFRRREGGDIGQSQRNAGCVLTLMSFAMIGAGLLLMIAGVVGLAEKGRVELTVCTGVLLCLLGLTMQIGMRLRDILTELRLANTLAIGRHGGADDNGSAGDAPRKAPTPRAQVAPAPLPPAPKPPEKPASAPREQTPRQPLPMPEPLAPKLTARLVADLEARDKAALAALRSKPEPDRNPDKKT